jgi:patatin-like phospholipase/acyl hydrolase
VDSHWLFVLQDLMDRIQKVKEKLGQTPLPCEWFDLIVGTSTGGLIALMLGRLKLSVNQAIDAYKDLAEEGFGTETTSWLGKVLR